MRRVMVVGSGGSGKSTFATRLGARTGLPVTHLDRHFWRPGWEPTPTDEWRRAQQPLVDADEWILDGNYSGTIDVRMARADTVILLDLGRFRCSWRVVKRTLGALGEERTAEGCPDRFDWEFSRWVWNYRRRSRPKILAAVERHASHVELVHLRTPREVRRFLTGADQAGRVVDDR